jgi:hypothetical protein
MKAPTDNENAPPGSAQRVVRRRLSAEDWDDAADLFEQGAALAEMSDGGMHSSAAKNYAVERMNSLAMFATRKAMSERMIKAQRERESSNDPAK